MKIGFCGIGAAGSNIAEVANNHGYRTGIINTSPEDLEAIKGIKNKLLIGKQAGCGKDRNIAKREVKSYYNDIVNFVKNTFEADTDITYIVFSASGGTGSGMSPIVLDLLTKFLPERKFGAIIVIPSKTESLVSQYNTLENLNEITKLNIPTLLVDNGKFENEDKKLSKKQLFDTINECVVADFDIITKKRKSSKYGNLDAKDLTKLLTTAGNMVIATKVLFPDSKETINDSIISSWDKSIYTGLEYDNVVKRIGYIFEIPDQLTKDIDHTSLQLETGKPLEMFGGYYVPSNEVYSVVSILAGLSFPEKRINEIKDILNTSKSSFTETKKINVLDNESSSWFNSMRSEPETTGFDFGFGSDSNGNNGELDLDTLFNNY